MATDDLVSVLIPMYNAAKYLVPCLKSVSAQTYQNLEIVVVDDGSTDQTYELAQKCAAADPRIILLQKANERNISKTRNFLLDHCHGKYVVWVDSDDYVKPTYIEKLYRALVDHDADWSTCAFGIRKFKFPILPPLRRRTQTVPEAQIMSRVIFGKKNGFAVWCKMYKRELLQDLRFSEVGYGEDLLFNIAYAKRCHKIACLNEKLYYYYLRSGSLMHQKFSEKHVSFVNQLLDTCEQETNPAIREAICGWACFTCVGYTFLVKRKQFPELVTRMRPAANRYYPDFKKNKLARFIFKFIVFLGIHTWCKEKKPR